MNLLLLPLSIVVLSLLGLVMHAIDPKHDGEGSGGPKALIVVIFGVAWVALVACLFFG